MLPQAIFPKSLILVGTRGDSLLYSDIIEFLSNHSLGFHAGVECTSGKLVVSALQKALFYLQPHLSTLNGRKSNFVPVYFKPLIEKNYNDPSSHHHAIKPLEKTKLYNILQRLYDCLALPAIGMPRWDSFKSSLEEIALNISNYVSYLSEKSESMSLAHHSSTPMRTPSDGSSSNVRFISSNGARKPHFITRYRELEKLSEKLDYYSDPLLVNDLAPLKPQARYLYIKELVLPYDCELYSYAYGNNLGTLWFLWRVPPDHTEWSTHRAKLLMEKIEKDIKVYHTREMRRQCGFRYHLLAKTSKSLFLDMYQFLTGDTSSTAITPGVHERLKIMIDSQDPDITFDLRHHNTGRPEHFKEFWSAVKGFINENALKAVDSRRHGSICYMALAVSVRDLHETVRKKTLALLHLA